MRPSGRAPDEMRAITIETGFTKHAEGSVLIGFGDTRVLCTASVERNVPPWLRGKGEGWVTGEYGMLPRATHTRGRREAAAGKQSGRTQEIQRLIGRSLRSVCDLKALGENQIIIDCDVLQADGGTRTASITGGFVALSLACKYLVDEGVIPANPIMKQAAAISVGVYQDHPVLDVDYPEDSRGEADMNVVMSSDGGFIEVQGTGDQTIENRRHDARFEGKDGKGCADAGQHARGHLARKSGAAGHLAGPELGLGPESAPQQPRGEGQNGCPGDAEGKADRAAAETEEQQEDRGQEQQVGAQTHRLDAGTVIGTALRCPGLVLAGIGAVFAAKALRHGQSPPSQPVQTPHRSRKSATKATFCIALPDIGRPPLTTSRKNLGHAAASC